MKNHNLNPNRTFRAVAAVVGMSLLTGCGPLNHHESPVVPITVPKVGMMPTKQAIAEAMTGREEVYGDLADVAGFVACNGVVIKPVDNNSQFAIVYPPGDHPTAERINALHDALDLVVGGYKKSTGDTRNHNWFKALDQMRREIAANVEKDCEPIPPDPGNASASYTVA